MHLDAIGYPFRNGGWVMILLGAIFAAVLDFFSHAPLVGFVVALFSAGYFSAYYLSIVGTTMNGSDTIPEWPSFQSFFDDIIVPYFRMILLVILSFGPAIILLVLAGSDDNQNPAMIWAGLAAALLGCFYFPMAVLSTSVFGGILAASPHLVIPATIRCLPGYLLDVIQLLVVFLLLIIAEEFAARIPYAGWALAAVFSIYGLMYQARRIGLIYRHRWEKLAWA